MMWIVGGAYCLILWLVFARLKLLKLTKPIAILAGSLGPAAILAVLFCAQYFHPRTNHVQAFQKVVPIVPQLTQPGHVTEVAVQPNSPVQAGEVLFEVDRIPYENSVERMTSALAEARQSVDVAQAAVELASTSVQRATSDIEFATAERNRYQKLTEAEAATQEQFDQAVARYARAAAAFDQASTARTQANLSVELTMSRVQQAEVNLQRARYDLDQTVVTAPADGLVTNLQLQPGMLVGGAGAQPVMTFVPDRREGEQGVVVAFFNQKNFLLIQPGQYAEVVLKAYPGQVLTGKVLTIIDASGAGQLEASGELPDEPTDAAPTRFAVRIALDEGQDLRLPGGLAGSAAVYTDRVPIAGIPIMFVQRMQAWLNYVF